MVHLLCAEHHAAPVRPTHDLDAGLDVRGRPDVLYAFTAQLAQRGFRPRNSGDGHQHRWVNDDGVQFDVLIPTSTGERSSSRRGVGGATTVSSPGLQQALARSSRVEVRLATGATGTVNRPSLLGALVIKAAAWRTDSPGPERHLSDLCVLATLVHDPQDLENTTGRDESYLRDALASLRKLPHIVAGIAGASDALDNLREIIQQNQARRSVTGRSFHKQTQGPRLP
jgi:hypothetical protein